MSYFKKISTAVFLSGLVILGYAQLSRAADPKITVTPSSLTYLPGNTITYTVSMKNDTGTPVSNASFKFYLKDRPASITSSTLESPTSGVDGNDPYIQTSTPQSLADGETKTYTVTVEIPLEYVGTTFKATAAILDSSGSSIENQTTTINLGVPVLTITKTGLTSIQRGGTIDYVIQVTNKGFAAATNVQVTDIPASYLTYVSSPGSTDCTLATSGGAPVVNCGPSTIEPNTSRTIILRFQVDALTPCNTSLVNKAEVIADTLVKKSVSASTTALCSTPTPTATISPTATPTPQIIYVDKNDDDDDGGSSGGSSSSEPTPKPKPKGQVKGIKTVAHTAAQQREVGYIPFSKAPLAVDLVFSAAFKRKPILQESTYWKNRARTDKYTTPKLYRTMLWYKAKGLTYSKNILQKPILKPVVSVKK